MPSQFAVLGGLLARDCNYDEGIYRYRIFWFIPVTGGLRYDGPAQLAMSDHMRDLVLPSPVFVGKARDPPRQAGRASSTVAVR